MGYKEFKEIFEKLKNKFESNESDINELEEKIIDLENSVQEYYEANFENNTYIKSLLNAIKSFKKENDFYNSEAELDRMFPDRHDEDFDEDSMSFDSVFGRD